MNVELAGALVGALASVVTVWPPCARALGRLTLNARAERQFHQAELFDAQVSPTKPRSTCVEHAASCSGPS